MPPDVPASAPPLPKAPIRKKLNEADREKMREVILRPDMAVDGEPHIPTIARFLGVSYQSVYAFAKNDPYLLAKVRGSNPEKAVPTKAELVAGKPLRETDMTLEARQTRTVEQQALFKQSAIITKQAWHEAGMSPEAAVMFNRNERIANQPLGSLVKVMLGGLVDQLGELDLKLIIVGDRLRNRDKSKYGDLPTIVDKNGNDMTELEWERVRLSMLAEKRAIYGTIIKAQVSMQTAERIYKELYGTGKKNTAPFGGKPLQVVAQPGSKVMIQSNQTTNGKQG